MTSALARLVLTAAVLGSACAGAREPLLVPIPLAGLRPVADLDSIVDYRTAAATVASIVQRDLGVAPFPVTFTFLPDRDAFEKALVQVGYETALARRVAATMTAVGGHRGVLLNDARFSSLPWAERVAMLAHELGHTVQYELGGGSRGNSDQWLREGFAEWLSLRVLERLNAASITEVRRVRLRELRAAGRSKAPRLADLVTFPEWVKASEQSGGTTYVLSFLAVDSLLDRYGVPAVLAYFKRFASSQERVENFRSAFGEDLQTFEAALETRVWKR